MTAYLGTCNDMCPASERNCPSRQLSIFECDELNHPNEQAMVKEYRRAGADQKEPPPEDLRTPMALEMTMDYLTAHIVNDKRSKNPELALEWYDFLWDRFRAVRKDITQQKICDEAATRLVERCARFHVHCCYAMSHVEDFDANMNKRSLNDCLQMLRQMYTDLRNEGIFCPNEFEFQKYDILLHLDRDPLSTNVLMKTSDHRNSKEMKFVIRIYNAYSSNDFFTFFKLLEKADYMTSCIMSLFASKMRLVGLRIIVASCTSRQLTLYPTELTIKVLGFDDLDDLGKFAALYDMEIQEKEGRYHIVIRKDLITTLRQVEPSVSFKSMKLVESKTPPSQESITRYDNETSSHDEQMNVMHCDESEFSNDQLIPIDVDTKSKIVEMSVNEVGSGIDSQKYHSAPTILVGPQNEFVILKSKISFDVQVGGHPKPFVIWYKNGRQVTESGDGRISFVEEEIDRYTGEVRESVRKESSTIHRLVINDVREVDEAIYSLKAENDLGSCKSSLVSLTIDRRKEATDEIREREEQELSNKRKVEESVVEETTVTTTTTTKTTDEMEDEELESERYHQKRSNLVRRTSEISDDEEEDGKIGWNKRARATTTREEEETEKSSKRPYMIEEGKEQLSDRKNTCREEVLANPSNYSPIPDDSSSKSQLIIARTGIEENSSRIVDSLEDDEDSMGSSPQIVAEMPTPAEILLKRQQTAELMPAGRMRKSYYSPKLKVIINELPPPVKVFKNRTDTFYSKTIQDIKSKIAEESKANSNLLTLLNFFESQ